MARLRSRSCIIDGEAVACDDNGVTSFNLVRYRQTAEAPAARLQRECRARLLLYLQALGAISSPIMAGISYFAAALGISLEAAAALLGIRHAADGDRTPQDRPILVGERGPEVFVPNTAGTVVPDWVKQKQWEYAARQAQPTSELSSLMPTDAQLRQSLALRDQPGAYYAPWNPRDNLTATPSTDAINAASEYAAQAGVHALSPLVKPEAWDRWLANAPMSEKIEDRRGPDATDMDEIRWRKWHEPKKPLKQFPAASTVPDWLKDQEKAWLTRKK